MLITVRASLLQCYGKANWMMQMRVFNERAICLGMESELGALATVVSAPNESC